MTTEHEIVSEPLNSHSGKCWFKCIKCGKNDWLELPVVEQFSKKNLNFYNTPCRPFVSNDNPARLTVEEHQCLTGLAEAWNKYLALPGRDTNDNVEFMRAIHAAQHMIAVRVARRVNPETWK